MLNLIENKLLGHFQNSHNNREETIGKNVISSGYRMRTAFFRVHPRCNGGSCIARFTLRYRLHCTRNVKSNLEKVTHTLYRPLNASVLFTVFPLRHISGYDNTASGHYNSGVGNSSVYEDKESTLNKIILFYLGTDIYIIVI